MNFHYVVSEVVGRPYGTLLLSPNPISLDDLAGGLCISKGSVSMNMRSLERWGMAEEVWMRGERKKYYAAEQELASFYLGRIADLQLSSDSHRWL